MVALIATDLDGTLLGPGAVLSARSAEALERARNAGVHVVAATGRAWRSASVVLEPTDAIEHALCSNGALHYDCRGDRVVRTDPVPPGAVAAAATVVWDAVDDVGLGWELDDGRFQWDERFLAHNPVLAELRSREGVDVLDVHDPPAPVLKVLVSAPQFGEDELFRRLHPLMPADVETTASGVSFVEITGAGVHKAKALRLLCDELAGDGHSTGGRSVPGRPPTEAASCRRPRGVADAESSRIRSPPRCSP